eukprot:355798-Chlamydomonas_euryale.AAC.5
MHVRTDSPNKHKEREYALKFGQHRHTLCMLAPYSSMWRASGQGQATARRCPPKRKPSNQGDCAAALVHPRAGAHFGVQCMSCVYMKGKCCSPPHTLSDALEEGALLVFIAEIFW